MSPKRRYTDEDMAAWREANPDSAPYPDEVEASTMAFEWFVLGRRFADVGRALLDALPAWLKQWLGVEETPQ